MPSLSAPQLASGQPPNESMQAQIPSKLQVQEDCSRRGRVVQLLESMELHGCHGKIYAKSFGLCSTPKPDICCQPCPHMRLYELLTVSMSAANVRQLNRGSLRY